MLSTVASLMLLPLLASSRQCWSVQRCNSNFSSGVLQVGILESFQEGGLYARQAAAALLAAQAVNNDTSVLRGRLMSPVLNDTSTTQAHMMASAAWQLSTRTQVVGVVGQSKSSDVLYAPLAAAANTLLLSYSTTDAGLNDRTLYPLYGRVIPSDRIVINAQLSLIQHFNWGQVNLILDTSDWAQQYAMVFSMQSSSNQIRIAQTQTLPDRMDGNSSKVELENLKSGGCRIVVVVLQKGTLIEVPNPNHSPNPGPPPDPDPDRVTLRSSFKMHLCWVWIRLGLHIHG